MDDDMIAEVDELLQGEHGKAITAFGLDCGMAALEGYKKGCVQSTLLGAGSVLLIFGAVKVGKKIIPKFKRQYESKKYVEV
jgi:hypothetical protein